MVKSMTGYGKGEVEAFSGTKKITVEVRTLNSKQLDLTVKLPPAYRREEYELRSLASRAIGRGKADVYVTVEDASTGGVSVDGRLFGEYYRQIAAAAKDAGMMLTGDAGAALVPAILRLPEVMAGESAEIPESESRALKSALQVALAALDMFRAQEGKILLDDMLARVDAICRLSADIEPFEKERIEVIRQRILDHIASVGVPVDQNRLAQEMVFWVEKLDITEEKVRLAKHCDYFRTTAGEEGAGRKLGFVAQEMGREINTLGSKANDARIQRLVVQMKDELEKIKEQLLNIL